MIIDCNIPQTGEATNILSILSIVLGILSIALSVWFFILSSRLSRDSTKAMEDIKSVTNQLRDIHTKYVEVIFDMFKNDHQRIVNKQLGGSETGGSKQDNSEKEEVKNG
jgi:LPXTG-motif cell wall-anchored protein